MIRLLEKIFIQGRDSNLEQTRQLYGKIFSMLGIFLNILLFAGKYLAGVFSGSIAITADAFNNLSDAGSSVITLIGFQAAGKKPDTEHPFGHGRMEYLSGMVVAVFIMLMGLELLKSSINKIFHPEEVEISLLAVLILSVSILVKLYMYLYNHRIGNKIRSIAMLATATDSLSDMIATAVVLFATLIIKYTGIKIDGYCGVLVALFIFYAGFNAVKDTLSPLLGKAPEKEFVEKIKQIVTSYAEVQGIHDLIVHDYGPGRLIISLHAEVSGDENIYVLHDAIDRIEEQLARELNCEAIIHMDPIDVNNREVSKKRKEVEKLVKAIDAQLSIHDFRMVSGETHTNLIFDVVLPSGYSRNEKEVEQEITKKIGEKWEDCVAVIKIEKSYIS